MNVDILLLSCFTFLEQNANISVKSRLHFKRKKECAVSKK